MTTMTPMPFLCRSCSPLRLQLMFLLLILTMVALPCAAETRVFDVTIEGTSSFVHFMQGYVIAPGSVDFSGLRFEAFDPRISHNKDSMKGGSTIDNTYRNYDLEDSVLELALVYQPEDCKRSIGNGNCDLKDLGIGPKEQFGWCCTSIEVTLGMCDSADLNRLIINEALFDGYIMDVDLPSTGSMPDRIETSLATQDIEQTGSYLLLLSNCNSRARSVQVTGTNIWRSKNGLLPGDRFYEWRLVVLMFFLYGAGLAWYAYRMYHNQERCIAVHYCILAVLTVAFLEQVIAWAYLRIWNQWGIQSTFATLLVSVSGVAKPVLLGCLLVMLCLGWKVFRDTLPDSFPCVLTLGITTIVAGSLAAILRFLYQTNPWVRHHHEGVIAENVMGIDRLLQTVAVFGMLALWMWAALALFRTIQYLKRTDQHDKMGMFVSLRRLIIVWALFDSIFITVVESRRDILVRSPQVLWTVEGIDEAKFLVILLFVAWLWLPQLDPSNYQPVQAMELSGMELGRSNNVGGYVPVTAHDDTDVDTDSNHEGHDAENSSSSSSSNSSNTNEHGQHQKDQVNAQVNSQVVVQPKGNPSEEDSQATFVPVAGGSSPVTHTPTIDPPTTTMTTPAKPIGELS